MGIWSDFLLVCKTVGSGPARAGPNFRPNIQKSYYKQKKKKKKWKLTQNESFKPNGSFQTIGYQDFVLTADWAD